MKASLQGTLILFFLLVATGTTYAQYVKISAEVRPRYEFRHGHQTLFPDGENPASFINQRTRLNGLYKDDKFQAFLSIQDVRVWGDVKQLNTQDFNGLTIHEAWGKVIFSEKIALKLGRQEISYDDQRIFGAVGWAQQARSHDAVLIQYTPNDKHKVDVGIAYNAMQESRYKVFYENKNYKTMQYAWYHGKFGKISLSVLALNNGLAYDSNPDEDITDEEVAFSQTIGPRLSYKEGKIGFNVAFYSQTGKNGKNKDLSAMYFSGDVSFAINKSFSLGIGGEYLSGTDSKNIGVESGKDNSFSPFYGTNHKFNGFMDYFYVGNHGGNVGLVDVYIPLIYKVKKFTFALIPHYLMTASELAVASALVEGDWEDYSSGLGTEVDFVMKWAFSRNVSFAGGYSQMFATESMQALKYPGDIAGKHYENTNNWAWIMITIKPTFFEKQ